MEEKKLTGKKNQHFVPQFYLKRFSIKGNEKSISLFDKKLEKFVPSTSLANQAAEKYYYGKDGEIEDSLAFSESIFAEVLKAVIETETLPKYMSRDHRQLLHFAVMTEYRNPIKKEAIERTTEVMGNYAIQHKDFPEQYRNSGLKLKLTDPVLFALGNHNKSVVMITDLHIKLLRNDTSIPFLTSDNPVVQYNQFLEQHTKLEALTGYAVKGLQIFIPISPKYMLLLYDSQIYYIGKRRSKIIPITQASEINQLNLLQMSNSNRICVGNEQVTELYMKQLHNRSNTFPRVRQEIHKKFKTGERSFAVYHAESSCRIGLTLSFVSFSTHASRVEFRDDLLTYPRDFALSVADALKNDPWFKDK